MLPHRQSSPVRERDICYSNLFHAQLCCHKDRFYRSEIEKFLYESFPGTTMLPHRQSYPFREWDVYYSNLFQAPLGCHKDRIPFSGIETFVIRIFSMRHYAATKAEFPFQGGRRLWFKSFPSTTTLSQMLNFPFRDRYVCYSNFFKAPLYCHTGRVPLSGSETFVIQIFSRNNYAAIKTEFLFQGLRRLSFESLQGATMLPQWQISPFRDKCFC